MLAEAVDSVLKQSQQSIEVLIIDDCSTDGTEEFVRSIQDSRVKYFRNETNSGPEFSRNFGLKQALGKYITFLDDDDYYTDYDFFKNAIKIFEEHDSESEPLAFVCANANMLMVESGEISTRHNIGEPGRVRGLDYILKGIKPLSTFPTVFKAEILKLAGFDTLRIFDYETYLRTALYGDEWIIADYIGNYRLHKESISLGYKSNTGNEERLHNKVIHAAERLSNIYNELLSRTDKTTASKWCINHMLLIMEYYKLHRKKNSFIDLMVTYNHILKTVPEFRYKIMKIIFQQTKDALKLSLRVSLRKITPLRNLYRLLRYGRIY